MKTLPRGLAVLFLALSLISCSGILPQGGPAPKLYTLTPAQDFPPDLPRLTQQLLVEVPDASAALNTSSVALRRDTISVDYFADVAWTDSAPEMVQNLLVNSFVRSGRATAVARETLALRGDFILRPELRHFEADYANNEAIPTVRVEIGLMLVRMPDRTIVATHSVSTSAKPTENSTPAILIAFDQALRQALRESVQWTLVTAK